MFKVELQVSMQPIIHIDANPDEEYPLRILKAYRENCDCKWISDKPNPVLDQMNSDCDKRVKILDIAIAKLKRR